jgi:hypothetical protein
MPFDRLKAPSNTEGLRVDTERPFLAPSNVSRFSSKRTFCYSLSADFRGSFIEGYFSELLHRAP